MKRASIFLVGISVLLIGLFLGAPLNRALAMNNNDSGSNNANTCGNTSFPAPYTGGASVVKFFHLSDGSTVTITATGAVIKQGRCGTPYREGWINVSDICNISSAQDLNGRLSSGSSNPNGSASFAGCSSNTQSSSGQQPNGTISIVNNNSQSQAQSNSGSGTQTAASASSRTNNGTATTAVQAATTTAATPVQTATQPAAAATQTLPNTGPGNVLLLSGTTTAIGTLGHMYYTRRIRR